MKLSALQIEDVALDKLKPYARNPRTHSDEQVAQIAASMREFGWTNPILVDEDGGIIAGHGRLAAARKLGMDTVPTIRLEGLTKAQRKALVIADNKLAMNAGWDSEMLKLELSELQAMDFDISLTGFGDMELAGLLGATEGLTDEDDAPEPPVEPVTRTGDLWVLGRHRLLCGDSTSADDVGRVLGGVKPSVCLTDPPYGLGGGKKSGKNNYRAYSDTRESLEALAADWLPIARSICPVVVFSPGVTNAWIYPEADWVMCWFYGGGQLRSSWGFNCWQPFLCYGKDPSLAIGRGARPDAVDMNTPANAADIDHPCPKPVKLWQWFIERLSFDSSDAFYEPFSGSGTTIIAAETTGRACHAIEIDPAYVDVAVKRWQAFTGNVARMDGDGRTFDEVAGAAGR